MTAFVPKSVLRALDELDVALGSVEASREEIKQSNIELAVNIAGLMMLLKRIKGEDVEDASKEFEKCIRAQDRLKEADKKKQEEEEKEMERKKPRMEQQEVVAGGKEANKQQQKKKGKKH